MAKGCGPYPFSDKKKLPAPFKPGSVGRSLKLAMQEVMWLTLPATEKLRKMLHVRPSLATLALCPALEIMPCDALW